jgi:hypothetical protein
VKLNPVGGGSRLTTLVVEEGDARHDGAGARAYCVSSSGHLATPNRCSALRAPWRGRLGDHLISTSPNDELKVALSVSAQERDRRLHLEDASLERQASWAKTAWTRASHQVADRRNP